MNENPYSDQVDEGYQYSPSTFSFMPGEQQGMEAMGLPIGPTQQAQGPSDYLGAIANYLGNAIPMKGTIQTSTPAAEGLANFVRRVWPSLGRAADRLPDMPLTYDSSVNERGAKLGANAWYLPPTERSAPQINIPTMEYYNRDQPKGAMDVLTSYLHELMHAIYNKKGFSLSMPPASVLGDKGALLRNLSETRLNSFGALPLSSPSNLTGQRHAAIDAMVKNILESKLADPSIVPPRLHSGLNPY